MYAGSLPCSAHSRDMLDAVPLLASGRIGTQDGKRVPRRSFSTRRDGNTRMQFINTKNQKAMTHVNFTTSGVALTDNQIARLQEIIEYTKRRSAWDKGVKMYALELLENYSEMLDYAKETGDYPPRFIESTLLNGANDWMAYSEGGLSLVYDKDIAERLCSPSEMKRKTSRSGMILPPNRIETWIQVQGRALNQAWRLLRGAALTVYKA